VIDGAGSPPHSAPARLRPKPPLRRSTPPLPHGNSSACLRPPAASAVILFQFHERIHSSPLVRRLARGTRRGSFRHEGTGAGGPAAPRKDSKPSFAGKIRAERRHPCSRRRCAFHRRRRPLKSTIRRAAGTATNTPRAQSVVLVNRIYFGNYEVQPLSNSRPENRRSKWSPQALSGMLLGG